MNQETLYQTIDRIFRLLKALREQYKTIDTWAKTRQLMDDTVDIYIALKTNPSIEEDTKFQDYIRKSAIELTSCTDYIYYFIIKMEHTWTLPFIAMNGMGYVGNALLLKLLRKCTKIPALRNILTIWILKKLMTLSKKKESMKVIFLNQKFPLVFLLPIGGGGILKYRQHEK